MSESKGLMKRFLKLPILGMRKYFSFLLKLSGIRSDDVKFPLFLFLNSNQYPMLSKLLLPISTPLSIIVYLIKLLKVIFVPQLIFQRLILLFLFQSLYELGGVWWRAVRWGIWSNISNTGRQAKLHREEMKSATTYLEWRKASLALSKLLFTQDNYLSKNEEKDLKKLKIKIKSYTKLLKEGSEADLRRHLRQDLLRKDVGYSTSNVLLRQKAKEYQSLQLKALNKLATFKDDIDDIVEELKIVRERLKFFKETKLSFGNSALLFSGGATLGLIHTGVIKALLEQNLIPKVIGGSSAGSICGAFLASLTEEEIKRTFSPQNLNLRFFGRDDSLAQDLDKLLTRSVDVDTKEEKEEDRVKLKIMDSAARAMIVALPPPLQDWLFFFRKLLPKYIDSKVLLSNDVLSTALRDVVGDITFLEAYNKTGRILNISVTPRSLKSGNFSELPQLLNYLTTPDVVIWSAAVASSSIPGVFAPQPLLKKDENGNLVNFGVQDAKWVDGSLECDLPISRIKEMFDVNHFIVSQVNPHARFIAPHHPINFFGFMPSALADVSDRIWTQLGAVVMFLRDQIRSWTKHVVDFSLKSDAFKRFGKGVLPLLTQKYHGDITLTPDISLSDFKGLLTNPTEEFFDEARLRGERMTWPQVSKIRRRCAIEFMLLDCIKALEKREEQIEQSLFQAYRSCGVPQPLVGSHLPHLKSMLKARVKSVAQFNNPIVQQQQTSPKSLKSLQEEEEEEIDSDVPMF